MSLFPSRKHPIRKLLSERGGNVVVIFALSSIPLLGFTGVAIDYSFATKLQTKLQSGTDATALTLCQTASTTTASQLQTRAQTTMTGFMGTTTGLVVDPLVITQNPRKILLSTRATHPSYFGKFTGSPTLTVGSKAQCATPMPATFEIALVLDTTGSMASSSGSGSKMDATKDAATDFVDYIHDDAAFASDTRLSVVPFAASVAVDPTYRSADWVDTKGKSAYHWTNVLNASGSNFKSRFDIYDKLSAQYSAWDWAGCFEVQPYPQNTQDLYPTANDALFVPMFAPDEPGDAGHVAWSGSTRYTKVGSYYYYNSYMDDATGSNGCTTDSSTAQEKREGQACKYTSPKNVYKTTSVGPNVGCTSKALKRLTNVQSGSDTLKTMINSLQPSGSTNIHEGVMWGWRTLSPNSVFKSDGQAKPGVNRVMVVMTDGANTWPINNSSWNVTGYFAHGYYRNADYSGPDPHLPPANRGMATVQDTRNALDALTLESCTNAKTAGISVYTIGFSVASDPIDQQGIDLLKACATAPNQAYVANDSDGLKAAFDNIKKSIGALRLTQ